MWSGQLQMRPFKVGESGEASAAAVAAVKHLHLVANTSDFT